MLFALVESAKVCYKYLKLITKHFVSFNFNINIEEMRKRLLNIMN